MSDSPHHETRVDRRVRAAARASAEETIERIERGIAIAELEKKSRLAQARLVAKSAMRDRQPVPSFKLDKVNDERYRAPSSEATPQDKFKAPATKTEHKEAQWFDAREDIAMEEEVKAFNALEKAVLDQGVDAKIPDLLSRESSQVSKHSRPAKPTITTNVAGRLLTRVPTVSSEYSVNTSDAAGASRNDYPTLLAKARATRAERAEKVQSETEPTSKEQKLTPVSGEHPITSGLKREPRVSVGGMTPLVYTHGPEYTRRREKEREASTARYTAKSEAESSVKQKLPEESIQAVKPRMTARQAKELAKAAHDKAKIEAESAVKQKLQDAGTNPTGLTSQSTACVQQPTQASVSDIPSGILSLPQIADLNIGRDSNGTGNIVMPSNDKDITATVTKNPKPAAKSCSPIKSIRETAIRVKQPARVSVSGQAPGHLERLEARKKSSNSIKGDSAVNTGPSTKGKLRVSEEATSITMPEQRLTDITTAVSGITIGLGKLVVSGSPRATTTTDMNIDHHSIKVDVDKHDFALVRHNVPFATNGGCLPNADAVMDQLDKDFTPCLKGHSGWDDGNETDKEEDWDQGGLAEWKCVGGEEC